MATWFTIIYEGEPAEADWARVAELAAQGYMSGQLINEPEPDDTDCGRLDETAVCILTGEPGENPDDCTTHEHEAGEVPAYVKCRQCENRYGSIAARDAHEAEIHGGPADEASLC